MNLPVIGPPVFGPTEAPNLRAPSNLGQDVWEGVSRVGGAISDDAERASRFAQKVRATDDAAGIMQIDSIAQAAAAEHEDYTRKNADVSTYDANAQEVWGKAQAAIAPINQRLSPLAQKHAAAMLDVNGRIFAKKAESLKTGQTISNAIGVFNAGMEKAEITMDPVMAHDVAQIAVSSGAKSKEEMAIRLETSLNKIDANRFAYYIKSDLWNPDIAGTYKLAATDGGHLGDKQLLLLQREQQIQQGFARGQTMKQLDTFREDPSNDPNGPIPGFYQTVNGKVKPMTISDIQKQQNLDGKWVSRWLKQVPEDDPQTISGLLSSIDRVDAKDYDQKTAVGRQNLANAMSTISKSSLSTPMKNRIFEILNRNIAGGVKDEKTAESAAYSMAADAFHKGATVPFIIQPKVVTPGKLWGTNETPEKTKGDVLGADIAKWEDDPRLSESAKAEGRANYMALRDVIASVTATNPKATNKDYSDAINEFLRPLNERKVAQALGATPSPEDPLEAEWKRRQKAKAKK